MRKGVPGKEVGGKALAFRTVMLEMGKREKRGEPEDLPAVKDTEGSVAAVKLHLHPHPRKRLKFSQLLSQEGH